MIILIIYHYKFFIPALIMLPILIAFNAGTYYFSINIPYHETHLSYGKMLYKPNIYLLILESYHGNEALKKLYHYDNQPFLDELSNLGFTVYKNVYSNAPHTRGSMSSIFAIKDLASIPKNLIDLLLTEPKDFKVSNTLLSNNYQIDYMFPTGYLTQMDSRCWQKFTKTSLFSQNYLKAETSACTFQYKTFEDFTESLQKFALQNRKKPVLFITKIGGVSEINSSYSGGVVHIPNKYRHSDKIEIIPSLKENYIDALKKENIILEKLIRNIIKADPNGLIVLIGDHGGQLFEIYGRKRTSKILPFLQKNNINTKDFLLDTYNILLAVKWPTELQDKTTDINFAPELFKVILEKSIPNLTIPTPARHLFDHDATLINDISLEDN